MLMSVVFPEPEGPISATHSPGFTAKLTPLSARSVPYCLIRLSMTTCCAVMIGCAGATELTLHLERPTPGAGSPAAAAGRRSGLRRVRSAPRLQDTQSAAAAPLRQKPLCRVQWTEKCPPQHPATRLPAQAAPPLQGTAASHAALRRRWLSSSRHPSCAPSPRWSSPPSRTEL